MKKYLVKKHCEATVVCTVALGRIQDYYYGNTDGYLSRDFLPDNATIQAYGYSSREAAQERLEVIQKSIALEKASGYWLITAEIVELEV